MFSYFVSSNLTSDQRVWTFKLLELFQASVLAGHKSFQRFALTFTSFFFFFKGIPGEFMLQVAAVSCILVYCVYTIFGVLVDLGNISAYFICDFAVIVLPLCVSCVLCVRPIL